MVTVICARCGEVHEFETQAEAEDYSDKEQGCPECEDWEKCNECGKWVEDSLHTVHTERGEREWCQSCVDSHAVECERCDKLFSHGMETVHTDGDDEQWCHGCRREDAWRCSHCGEWYHDDCHHNDSTVGVICDGCAENAFQYCDTHEEYQNSAHPCNCNRHGQSSTAAYPYARSEKWNVRGYGGHGNFAITNKWGTKRFAVPAVGLEMEVGDFLSDNHRNAFGANVFVPLLGDNFAYPTSDSSLGPRGIEFIGHPMGVLDHLDIADKYNDFFCGLAGNRATCANSPSGCHTNFSKDSFVNDDSLRAAIIACVRFYDALMLFTHPDQKRRRMGFCKKADLRSGIDPLVQCKSSGKYSIVNIKPNEGSCGIVEFRLAGMTLHKGRFLAQLQMYHNLVAWANQNAKTPEKAGWDTFEDIFLPVMFQDDIQDVIKKGRVAMQLPLGDPALSSAAPATPTFDF